MNIKYPYFEKAVAGFTAGFSVVELGAVAELVDHPGWKAVQRYLDALMVEPSLAVYTNTDPSRQLDLHKGIGSIYVAANLAEFIASAKAEADRLVQQEASASLVAEQVEADMV